MTYEQEQELQRQAEDALERKALAALHERRSRERAAQVQAAAPPKAERRKAEPRRCAFCQGSGWKEPFKPCKHCGGKGTVSPLASSMQVLLIASQMFWALVGLAIIVLIVVSVWKVT